MDSEVTVPDAVSDINPTNELVSESISTQPNMVITGSDDEGVTKERRQEILKKLIEKHQLKNRLNMNNGFETSDDPTWISPTRSPFKIKKSRMRNKMRRATQQQMRRKG